MNIKYLGQLPNDFPYNSHFFILIAMGISTLQSNSLTERILISIKSEVPFS